MDEEEDEKVFVLAGYTTPQQMAEKKEIIDKIKKLGGEVELTNAWNPRCTHVITATFSRFNGKVLASMAAGGWVVTRRFVDKSFKTGTWKTSLPFICDEIVKKHRIRQKTEGGCFRVMKVLFLMEDVRRRQTYTDIVIAGGGTVVQNWTIQDLIQQRPVPHTITHIVVDPYIHSKTDPRHEGFMTLVRTWGGKWKDRFIYYKFFFHYLRYPEDEDSIPENFSIFENKVLQKARENGDFLKTRRDQPAVVSTGSAAGGPQLTYITPPPQQQQQPPLQIAAAASVISAATPPPINEQLPQVAHPNCATISTQAKALVTTANKSLPPATVSKQSSSAAASCSPSNHNYEVTASNSGSEVQSTCLDETEDIIVDNERTENTKDIGSKGDDGRGGGKRSSDAKDTNERDTGQESKRQRTQYTTHVVEANVIDLSDSDDDIEVLEQKLANARHNDIGCAKERVYIDSQPQYVKNIRFVNIDVSDEEDGSRAPSDIESLPDQEDGGDKQEAPVQLIQQQEDEIQILGVGKHMPRNDEAMVIQTKKSNMFKAKLDKVKAREEKRENKENRRKLAAATTSQDNDSAVGDTATGKRKHDTQKRSRPRHRSSRDSFDDLAAALVPEGEEQDVSGAPALPVIPNISIKKPVAKPAVPLLPLHMDSKRLHQILDSINKYHEDTSNDIEISLVTQRTAKYDKFKESQVTSRSKLVNLDQRVTEEFSLDKQRSETNIQVSDALEKLEYLQCYTNLLTHPTSFILHTILTDYLLKQRVRHVARTSYKYLDTFVVQYLGRDGVKHVDWLYLMLTALRESTRHKESARINLESVHDIQTCHNFFAVVLQTAMSAAAADKAKKNSRSRGDSGPILMLKLLVNICHRDLEFWWKHYRKTDQKDERLVSYPIIYYLLNGSMNLMKHMQKTVVKFYADAVQSHEDLVEHARKLVAMCGMLAAHLDYRDLASFVSKGLKQKLAHELADVFTNCTSLPSDSIFIEMNLLSPSWLSQQVSRAYLSNLRSSDESQQQIIPDLKGVKDVVDNAAQLATTCNTDLIAAMDNFLIKSFAFMHIHDVVRTHWHYQILTPHTTGPKSKSDEENTKAVAAIDTKVNGAVAALKGDTPSSSGNLPPTTNSANTEKPEEEKEDVEAYAVFSSTVRLVKAKSSSASAKAWQQNTAVKVGKVRLIEDANSIVDVINKDKNLPSFGVLKSLIFPMTEPDKY